MEETHHHPSLNPTPPSPHLRPGRSGPTPQGVPHWRRTTRVSWWPAAGLRRRGPSCRPFVSCSASPSRRRPTSWAAACASSGPPAASLGWAPCPAAAAPGSAPGGWPWWSAGGGVWREWTSAGGDGGGVCGERRAKGLAEAGGGPSEGAASGCGLHPSTWPSSSRQQRIYWTRGGGAGRRINNHKNKVSSLEAK